MSISSTLYPVLAGRSAKLRPSSYRITSAIGQRTSFSGELIVDPDHRTTVGDKFGLVRDAMFHGARSFNGASSVLSGALMTSVVDNFTLGVWARPATLTGEQVMVANGLESNGYALELESGLWKVLYGGIFRQSTGIVPTLDEWVLLCVRRSSGTTQGFVGGVSAGSTFTNAPNAPTTLLSVGAHRNGANTAWDRFFSGSLAHAFLYTSALSNDQIAALATGGPGGMGLAPTRVGSSLTYYPITGLADPEPNTQSTDSLTVTSASALEDTDAGPEVLSSSGLILFAGSITQAPESGLDNQPVEDSGCQIAASDYLGYPSQRIVTVSRSSETLKVRLAYFVTTYLSAYGVTLSGSQDDGPTLDARDYQTEYLSDILQELQTLTQRVFTIDGLLVASMLAPADVSAPFDVAIDSDGMIGDISVEPTDEIYANTVYIVAGDARVVEKTDTFTGDGATSSWTLTYSPVGNRGYVTVQSGSDGIYQTLGSGAQWGLSGSTLTRAAGALSSGDTVTIVYDAQFPIVVSATDATEVANRGPVDVRIDNPALFDYTAALAQANAELTVRKTASRTVRYQTTTDGLAIGMSQHITEPDRALDDDVVLTAITAVDQGDRDTVLYSVTAVTGLNFKVWQQTYQQWGGSSKGAALGSGVLVQTSIGQGSGPTSVISPRVLQIGYAEATYSFGESPMSFLVSLSRTSGTPPDSPSSTYVIVDPNGADRVIEGIYCDGPYDSPAGQVLVWVNPSDTYSFTFRSHTGVTGNRHRQILTPNLEDLVIGPNGTITFVLQQRGSSYFSQVENGDGWKPIAWTKQASPSTTYTAAWTGSVTNPAIGNGTIASTYRIMRDGRIRASITITIGSTTTFGSGTYAFSTPFTMSYLISGQARIVPASGNVRTCQVWNPTGTTVALYADNVGAISQGSPVTLAAGDIINIWIEFHL